MNIRRKSVHSNLSKRPVWYPMKLANFSYYCSGRVHPPKLIFF
jgi:hypothetical protein